MMRKLSLVIALVFVSGAAMAQDRVVAQNQIVAQNQYENSPEDRACRTDARRFCRDDIPDQFKVGSCLQAHKDRLTRACREMLESHGMM
jgi:hypothetical protein